jgi:glutathione S-transferase
MAAGPDQAAAALAEVDRSFDWIEEILADGRPYLVGDRFTAADLAFAALSAAVLMPERYGVTLPRPEDYPGDFSREVERLRRRPAGVFAARIVEAERPWPPGSGASRAAGGR